MLTPPPPRGSPVAMEAFSGRSAFCTPKQLGPTSRTRPARAAASARACSAAPSGPVSAKPALSTTAALTRWAAAASMTAGTLAAGVATMARSMGPGTSRRSAQASTPPTICARHTGTTSPGKPARLSHSSRPTEPGRSEAPTRAIRRGSNTAASPLRSSRPGSAGPSGSAGTVLVGAGVAWAGAEHPAQFGRGELRLPDLERVHAAAGGQLSHRGRGRRPQIAGHLQREPGRRADLGHAHVGVYVPQPGLPAGEVEHAELGDQPLWAAAGEAEFLPGALRRPVPHVGDEVAGFDQRAARSVPGGPQRQVADGCRQVAAAASTAELHL